MKEEMEKDERFIIRTYEKAELAPLQPQHAPRLRHAEAACVDTAQPPAHRRTHRNRREQARPLLHPPASVTHRGGAGRTLKQASFR